MCPQFSTPEAHCECCVWHFYGKRGIPDADVSIRSSSIFPATAAAAAAAHAASGDYNSFEDTPCPSNLYSNPDSRVRFSASLKTIKQRLQCLLWLKKNQLRNQSSFFLWPKNRKQKQNKNEMKWSEMISKEEKIVSKKKRHEMDISKVLILLPFSELTKKKKHNCKYKTFQTYKTVFLVFAILRFDIACGISLFNENNLCLRIMQTLLC